MTELVPVINGPPFASGAVHLGSAANQVVKDFWTRLHQGRLDLIFDAQGLPIEHAMIRQGVLGADWITSCVAVAQKNARAMQADFERLGCRYDRVIHTHQIDYKIYAMHVLRQLWDRGHLYQAVRHVEYCPKCDTTLAKAQIESHRGESLVHLLRFTTQSGVYLLTATTQPQTVVNAMGFAVGSGPYGVYDWRGDQYLCAHPFPGMVWKRSMSPLALGRVWVNQTWRPILISPMVQQTLEVTTNPLTNAGVVMLSPAHTQTDWAAYRAWDPQIDATLARTWSQCRQRYVQGVRNQAYRTHWVQSVPMTDRAWDGCWRCQSRVARVLQSQWYLRTSSVRSELVAYLQGILQDHRLIGSAQMAVRTTNWWSSPVDWAITRSKRYLTPYPFGRCVHAQCGEMGRIQPLTITADMVDRLEDCYPQSLDRILHRHPANTCGCGRVLQSLRLGVSVWFDSAVLPLYLDHRARMLIQGKDQDQAWFYYISVLSLMMGRQPPFERLHYTGWVLGQDGRKLSKRSTPVSPGSTMIQSLVERYGKGCVRSYLVSSVSTKDYVYDPDQLYTQRKYVNLYHNLHRYRQLALSARSVQAWREIAGDYQSPVSIMLRRVLDSGEVRKFWLKIKVHALEQVSRRWVRMHRQGRLTPLQQARLRLHLDDLLRVMAMVVDD